MELFGIAPDEVGVDDGRPVGTAGVLAARSVVIAAARFLQSGVIGNHRVDAAGRHSPEQVRFAKAGNIGNRFRVRLGDDADAVTGVEQHFPNDRGTDKGAVNIGIAGHQDDVERIPAQAFDFFGACRKEHGVIIVQIKNVRAGNPAAPGGTFLPLLPFGSDGVRKAPPRRTHPDRGRIPQGGGHVNLCW